MFFYIMKTTLIYDTIVTSIENIFKNIVRKIFIYALVNK